MCDIRPNASGPVFIPKSADFGRFRPGAVAIELLTLRKFPLGVYAQDRAFGPWHVQQPLLVITKADELECLAAEVNARNPLFVNGNWLMVCPVAEARP